jgi:Leucine-rich repeat (LRR) protein
MDLSYNDFNIHENIIPSSFCNLSNLTSLTLTTSYLSGSIPTCLGKLLFGRLDLSFNNLSGPIPPLSNPGRSYYDQRVILSNNHLTGPIPNEFGNLGLMSHLDLGGNRLSGTIPYFIFQLHQLRQLDLSNNMFTGEFLVPPPKYNDFNPSLVTYLDISNNYFNNSVSLFLSNLYSTDWGVGLETLRIGGNLFHGPLQLDFSLFEFLQYFSATSNQITGPIPQDFGTQNSSIVLIDLSHNQLTGDIRLNLEPQVAAKTLSALRVLTLAHNKLIGPIPLWITRLKSLQVLDLSFNTLTGSIPSDLHSLLGYKVVSSNLGGFNDFTLVQTLNLATQKYTYILLTTTYMDLSSNALTGDIPPSIVQLSGLLYLYLSNNKLTGNIPSSLGNLSQLERLDFSCNNLTGEIPPNLRSLSYLQIFNVSFNYLSGPIPTGGQFVGFSNTSYLPGNDGLCGEVIHQLCNSTPLAPEPSVSKEAISYEDIISLPGLLIGVGVGFFSVAFCLLYWQHGHGLYLSNARHNKPLNRRYGAFKHPC